MCVCRFVLAPQPICLERDITYTLSFEFSRYQDTNSVLSGAASVLVDSVRRQTLVQRLITFVLPSDVVLLFSSFALQISLMPRYSAMEIFSAADAASNSMKQMYERYRCHEGAKSVTRPPMSDTCAKLITSMSAIINDGALRECTNKLLILCVCVFVKM